MKMLIVDDNEDSRIVLKKILESIGHTVEVAENGEEALKVARESSPDMIISDILMPVMDGFQLCRKVREDDELKDIPFVFYTATYTDEKDEELALKVGADRFIRKPVEPDEFIKIIQGVIRGVEKGKIRSKKLILEEEEVFKLYSERLVKKLEKKMLNLEREIAKCKQAEEALQESEEKYRSLVESTEDSIYLVDRDCRYLFVNQKHLSRFGLPIEKVIGSSYSEFHSKKETKGFAKKVNQVFETGRSLSYEYRSERDAGYCIRTLSLVKKPEGRTTAVTIVSKDITEIKKAEEALQESEGKFRLLTEQNLLGIIIIQDGLVKYVNKAASGITEYSIEEALEWKVDEFAKLFHPDDLEFVMKQAQKKQIGEKDVVTSYSYHLITKSGKVKLVDQYSKTIIYEGKTADLITLIDVTEKKKAEEALKESEEKYRELIESSKDGIIITDKDGKVSFVNPAYVNMLGYKSPDELIRKPAVELYANPEQRKKVLKELKDKGYLKDLEVELVKKDGSTLHTLSSVTIQKDKQDNIIKTEGIVRDITEKKKAEEEFKIIFNLSPDMICIATPDGKFTKVNPAWEKVLGYTQEELLKLSWTELIHPDDVEPTNKEVEKQLKGSSVANFINRFRCKDGSYRLFEWQTTPYEGGIVHATARDVTERKKAEEVLKESEEQFQNLFNSMREGFALCQIILDEKENPIDYRFLKINPAFGEQTGMSVTDSLGKTVKEIYPDIEPYWIERYGSVAITGEPMHTQDYNHNTKKWYDAIAFSLSKGKFAMLFRDITERKKTEESLAKSEVFFRSQFELGNIGIAISTPEKSVMRCNERLCEILGYNEKELRDIKWTEITHPEDLNQDIEQHNRILSGEIDNYALDKRFIRPDGSIVYTHLTVSGYRNKNGETEYMVASLDDITERKKAEEALKQSSEKLLREYNQRKILSKRLIDLLEKERHQIAMELHDHIGQTLTSLKIDIEMLNDQLKPFSSKLRFMAQAAADKTMQAMKDVKSVSHGLRPTMIDALGIVSSFRNLFSEIKQQTGMEIRFFNRGIPKRFEGGKELAIYRIAQEALTNVIRHARAKHVFVNLVKKDDKLSLSVEDDGVGFDQDKVMQFSKRKGPLGLLIMRERASQFDGEFTIESQPGKGTHLLVEIPL